jgi:MoaA/NifB/PqqE/SkfB family radical SAM enzyme
MSLFRQAPRLYDRKPWAAHLYVTDQCNLDCHYCNEYDNSVPHPATEDLKAYLDKISELGCLRIGFQGGEPLMHPDIVALVRHAKQLGFLRISMSTNGLRLTRPLLRDLGEAGLDALQISVDRMTPIESTRKSLKSVRHKLAWFDDSPVKLHVAGVLFHDSLDEAAQVIDECLKAGVRVHCRVIHDDMVNDRKLRLDPAVEGMNRLLEHQEELKRRGGKIHTSWRLLEYQRDMLAGTPKEWSCVAGYKYFFVSARGQFWLCSQVRTERHILDIAPDDLLAYDHPKECQPGCGVYCTVDMSLAVNDPGGYLTGEAVGLARNALVQLKRNSGRNGRPIRDPDATSDRGSTAEERGRVTVPEAR